MTNTGIINEIDFLYCPLCGGKVESLPPRLRRCKNCNIDLYINAKPCNAVIIANEKGEILLTERRVEPSKGLWDLPGGFIDIEETAEQSVEREMREELGIEVKDIKYLCSGCERYIFKRLNYHTLGFVFTVSIASGTLVAKDDVASFRFFAKDEIPWDSLAFPVLKKTLEIYYSNQR